MKNGFKRQVIQMRDNMKRIKILFAHDLPIIKNSIDSNYYSKTIGYEFWSRYLEFTNDLQVAVRVKQAELFELDSFKKISSENVQFLDMPNLAVLKGRMKNLKKAKKIISKSLKDIDAVVVRLPSEVGLLTYGMAKKRSIPVAIEMVGCPQDSYNFHGSLLGKVYSPYARIKYKKVLSESTHTLYVTAKYLQKKYPSPGFSINASNVKLNNQALEVLDKRISLIKEKNENDVYKIGISGSLNVNYKGLDTAIKAIQHIRKNSSHKVILEVIGGGDESKWVDFAKKIGCEKYVIFKGRLTSQEVFKWLENIDVYIQPSKTEGLPRALVEAMSTGCPCIGTRVGGIPELLNEEFLVEKNDYKILGEKIVQLVESKKERVIQAQNNYYKSTEYSAEKLKAKRSEFYSKFLEEMLVER